VSLWTALKKTQGKLASALRGLGGGRLDDEVLEELEEALILADTGPEVALDLVAELRRRFRRGDSPTELLAELITDRLPAVPESAEPAEQAKPEVLFLVGVNGAGKTTTAAKLAFRAKQEGRRVLLAAADTYRAAAGEQLEIWARRAGVPIVKHGEGGDAGAVLFDALEAARAREIDLVIADTAGRLHNKSHLMAELNKLRRVAGKVLGEEHPQRSALVLDAVSGQNGLHQARAFLDAGQPGEVILTKLDGSARGGIVLAIVAETGLPISWIGTGEGIDDLEPFDRATFSHALLGLDQN